MNRRKVLKVTGAGIIVQLGSVTSSFSAAFAAVPALAQQVDAFPSSPVRIVVPVNLGGNADRIARMLAQGLAKLWQQTR